MAGRQNPDMQGRLRARETNILNYVNRSADQRQEADRQTEEVAIRRQQVHDLMREDDSLNDELQIVKDNLGIFSNEANKAISDLARRNGQLNQELALAEIDKYDQAIFGHAVTLVTAHEGSVERFTKLSDAHQEALCAVQTNSIQRRLSRETADKEAAEREAIHLREDVQRLQDSIKTRAEQHQSALRDELEKHRKVVEKDDRLHRGAMKDLSTLYNKNLDKRREAHVDALKTLGNKHDRALEAQLAGFQETLKTKEKEHEAALRMKQKEHESALTAQRQNLDRDLEARQKEHEKALEAQLAGFLETSSVKQKEHEDALKAERENLDRTLNARLEEHERALNAEREELLVAQQAAQTAFEQSDKSKDQDCLNLTANLLNLSAEREELQEEHEGLQTRYDELENSHRTLAYRENLKTQWIRQLQNENENLVDEKQNLVDEKEDLVEHHNREIGNLRAECNVNANILVRTSEFLVGLGGSNEYVLAKWSPFAREMIETDAKADRACPRESLPWSVLPCWDRYENQRLEPQPSAHVAELTCRLFRHAADESWKEETIYLLDLLRERLLEVEYAPIKGILHMIEKFLEGLGEFIETVRREVPDQMVLLSLHQLATLIKTRWRLMQKTHLVHARVELRMKEVALPNDLLGLMRTLDSDPSAPRSLSAKSEDHFFCESSETLLSTVSTAPGWIVAFGLLNRSLWLVHETRGQYDETGRSDLYRVIAPEPLQDISFSSSIPGATWFIIKKFRTRYSLEGLVDFMQA